MEITVELQPMLMMKWIVPVVAVIALAAGIVLWLRVRRWETSSLQEAMAMGHPIDPVKQMSSFVRKRYLHELELIEKRLKKKRITVRQAYQSMSVVVRGFVTEATGKRLDRCTRDDVLKLKLDDPSLEALWVLLVDYSEPEFAEQSEAEFSRSANKTRRTIQEWKAITPPSR